MRKTGSIRGVVLAALLFTAVSPAIAAMNTDPDWPCIQRKVPELSLGQIWDGPVLPSRPATGRKTATSRCW